MGILIAISGMGMLVAGQQYVFLQAQKDDALSRRTLDESFLVFMKAAEAESNPVIDEELAHRKTIIKVVDSNAAAMIGQLEFRAIADFIAWCVVLVISTVVGFLNNRKEV
jgi:hypothetical protein